MSDKIVQASTIQREVIHHRRRKVYNIGGPRFRILGGGGGQIPSRHMTP